MQGPQMAGNLSAESDDHLVSLSISGNEEATAILIVRYLSVINKIAVELDKAGQKPADISANPEMLVLEQEAMDWFSKEMGELLSQKERKVFLLYLEGYEPSQVAEALDLPVKSVYNSLGRVRKKLKTAFHLNQNG